MILECLKDCYMEDKEGNITDNRCFKKGKIYQVISSDGETRTYNLIDDNNRFQSISFFSKSFKPYIKCFYIVDVQGRGKLLLRALSHTEAVKKASTFIGNNIDFSVTRIDFQMDDEGRIIKYEF